MFHQNNLRFYHHFNINHSAIDLEFSFYGFFQLDLEFMEMPTKQNLINLISVDLDLSLLFHDRPGFVFAVWIKEYDNIFHARNHSTGIPKLFV